MLKNDFVLVVKGHRMRDFATVPMVSTHLHYFLSQDFVLALSTVFELKYFICKYIFCIGFLLL